MVEIYSNDADYFAPKSEDEDYPLHIPTEESVKYNGLEAIFNDFLKDNSLSKAKENSKAERNVKELSDGSLTYGEVTFNSIAYIFEYLKNTTDIKEGYFYDLGSGAGRGVFATLFCYPFEKYIGIELLEGIYKISLESLTLYKSTFPKILSSNKSLFPQYEKESEIPEVEFINKDFRHIKIPNASVILCNSTCFTTELMYDLSSKFVRECESGCIVITFTRKLPSLPDNWEVKRIFRRIMSWGIATVFLHKKK